MSSGGKGGGKQQVTDYRMSLHLGISTPADAITGLYIDDKTIWEGEQDVAGDITINQPNVFGGPKQGGGAVGVMRWLPGGATQVLPDALAERLSGLSGALTPAFRNIASVFFTGINAAGFLWTSNNPIVAQKVSVRIRRTPKTMLDQTVLRIPTVQDTGFAAGIGAGIADAAAHLANSINASSHYFYATSDATHTYIATKRSGSTYSGAVTCPSTVHLGSNRYDVSPTSGWTTTVITFHELPVTADTVTLGSEVYTFTSSAGGEVNPAHIIFEVLTEKTYFGMGGSTALLDAAAFNYAGSILFSEGLGLALEWNTQKTVEDFVNDILNHINGYIFTDPSSGLLTLKLLRADYDPSTLPVFDPTNAEMGNFQRKGWGETINQIDVTWTNPANNQPMTTSHQDIGNVSVQGGVVSDSRNYYGVRNEALAAQLAARECSAVSTPLFTMELYANRDGWNLTPGGLLILNWPEESVYQAIMRIANIDYGKVDDAKITVNLIQDIFSLDRRAPQPPAVSAWVDPSSEPPVLTTYQVSTIPAYFAAGSAFQGQPVNLVYPEVLGMVFAFSANRDVTGYDLWADTAFATGGTAFALEGTKTIVEYGTAPAALTVQAVSTIPVNAFANADRGPQVGGFIFLGAGDAAQEICLVASTDGTNWTVNRGVLDTVPQAWAIGTPMWAVNPGANIVEDKTVRSATEIVEYKLLSRSSLGVLAIADAPEIDTTLTARPHLPLRPANVKVNGTAFGTLAIGSATTLAITWATRNRTLEDGQVTLWTDAAVAGEYGQASRVTVRDQTNAIVYQQDGIWSDNALSLPVSYFARYSSITIELDSTMAGLASLQGYAIKVTGLANNPAAALPPAPPAITPIPSPVAAPGATTFTVVGTAVTAATGESTPIIKITGASDNASAIDIAIRYRVHGTTTWTDHPLVSLTNFSGVNITGLAPGTSYDVEIAYQLVFGATGLILSLWQDYGPVTTGGSKAGDVVNVGGTSATTVLANISSALSSIASLTTTYGSTAAAAVSAAAAAADVIAAASTVASAFPRDFSHGDAFFTSSWAGAPSAKGYTYPAVSGIGTVAQIAYGTTAFGYDLATTALQQMIAGRTYRITAKARTTVNPTSGTPLFQIYALGYDASGTYNSVNQSNSVAAPVSAGLQTLTIVLDGTTELAAGAVYIAPMFRGGITTIGSFPGGGTQQLESLFIEDITESVAATAAAVTSQSYSSTASGFATAASISAASASTDAGAAHTYQGQAATSEVNAAASAVTAGTDASNALASANTATTQASAASASAALASSSAVLSASFTASSLCKDPTFSQWGATTLPTYVGDWQGNAASYISKVAGKVSANALRLTQSAGSSTAFGFYETTGSNQPIGPGYYVIEATIELVSGSFDALGIYPQAIQTGFGEVQNQAFAVKNALKDDGSVAIGAGVAGKTYFISQLIHFTPTTTDSFNLYAMSWPGTFGGTSACVADISKLSMRPASMPEIAGNAALGIANTNTATITANASAQATQNSAFATQFTNLTAIARAGTNMLTYGNFENGFINYTGMGAGAFVYQDAFFGHLAYLGTATGSSPVIIVGNSTAIPVGAGVTYTASGNLQASGMAGATAEIALNWLNSSGVFISQSLSNAVTSLNASTLGPNAVCTATAPAGATQVVFYVVCQAPGTGTLSGYAQKLKFEQGSIASAWDSSQTDAVNVANVTTTAAALATLDGQVYGTYGINVNANGAAASLELFALSGPTTISGIALDGDVLTIKSSSHPAVQPFVYDATTGEMTVDNVTVVGDTKHGAGSSVLYQGNGFGASSDLVLWYGPTMARNLCTKANAKFYLDNAGDGYFGGSLIAGTLTTAAQTSALSNSASITTAVFGSNGGTITVTASFAYACSSTTAFQPARPGGGTADQSGTDSFTLTLYRGVNGGALSAVASWTIGGTWTWHDDFGSTPPIEMTASTSGSWTYTDPANSTDTRQYELAITAGSPQFGYPTGTGQPSQQRVGLICVEP